MRILIALLAALIIAQGAVAERLALVIGNAEFERADDLPQTAADARAMGTKLQSLGFTLVGGKAHINLSRGEMLRQVRALGRQAEDGDEVVFYFSGHGIGGTQTNYLLPVNDGEIEAREDVPDLAVDVASVLDRLPKSASGINIVILDACRDNPLPSRAKSAYAEKGLARISNAASNTVFLYAAKPGEQAYVSPAGRSYFTDALLSKIDAPGQNLSELIYSVQQRVLAETGGQTVPQTPWFEGVAKPYYFVLPASNILPQVFSFSPGTVFRDTLSDGTQGPEMVVIPAGSFMMGSPQEERDRGEDEGPQRTVTISEPFASGKFEVTWDEWQACVSDGGCASNLRKKPDWGEKGDAGWGKGNRPVINVSWLDATAYVQWLSRQTGEHYTLLSESRWEYAARAGTTTAYSWGKSQNRVCEYANGADLNGKDESRGWITSDCRDGYGRQTAPVGSFEPNAFGLYDMHGNVWEWVEDCYEGSYSGAPTTSSARTSGSCERLVVRGGSWFGTPTHLRSANRSGGSPGGRYNDVGFRVARVLND